MSRNSRNGSKCFLSPVICNSLLPPPRIPGSSRRRDHLSPRWRGRSGRPAARIGQHVRPSDQRLARIFQTQFLNGFVVFGKQRWTTTACTLAPRPCGEAIKGLAPPKTRTDHHVGVEDHSHYCAGCGRVPRHE